MTNLLETDVILLTASEAAALCKISIRSWFLLNSLGNKIPPPIRIGGSVRWSLADINIFLRCNGDMSKFIENKNEIEK